MHEHYTSMSIRGGPLSNLQCTDSIDLIVGSNGELQALTDSLVTSASAYDMDISTDESKTMVNAIV